MTKLITAAAFLFLFFAAPAANAQTLLLGGVSFEVGEAPADSSIVGAVPPIQFRALHAEAQIGRKFGNFALTGGVSIRSALSATGAADGILTVAPVATAMYSPRVRCGRAYMAEAAYGLRVSPNSIGVMVSGDMVGLQANWFPKTGTISVGVTTKLSW